MATIGEGLQAQWDRAWMMFLDVVAKIGDEAEWRRGSEGECEPARLAYHSVGAAHFYTGAGENGPFPPIPDGVVKLTWTESPLEQFPSAEKIAEWVGELRARMDATFAATSDEEMLTTPSAYPWTGANLLEHWLYGLRHLCGHTGELHGILRSRGLPLGDWH